MKLLVAIVVGVILGILNSRYWLVGSGLSLISWGIVGLVLGYWCTNRKETLISGSVYGFVLSFVFMLAGYNGSAPIIIRVPFLRS